MEHHGVDCEQVLSVPVVGLMETSRPWHWATDHAMWEWLRHIKNEHALSLRRVLQDIVHCIENNTHTQAEFRTEKSATASLNYQGFSQNHLLIHGLAQYQCDINITKKKNDILSNITIQYNFSGEIQVDSV